MSISFQRDIDRMLSFFIAPKECTRKLVIDLKQAYILKLFNQSEFLRGRYPAPDDDNIKFTSLKSHGGLIDKDLQHMDQKTSSRRL